MAARCDTRHFYADYGQHSWDGNKIVTPPPPPPPDDGRAPHLVVRQAGGGEDRDLLSARDAVHPVDRRDSRLDHLLRVDARPRIDRLACVGEHKRARSPATEVLRRVRWFLKKNENPISNNRRLTIGKYIVPDWIFEHVRRFLVFTHNYSKISSSTIFNVLYSNRSLYISSTTVLRY